MPSPTNKLRTTARRDRDLEELADIAEWFAAQQMMANAALIRRIARDLKRATEK